MKIEEQKNNVLTFLNELEAEVTILHTWIDKAKKEISKVSTEEDIDNFIQNNDLEKGLDYISLHLIVQPPRHNTNAYPAPSSVKKSLYSS